MALGFRFALCALLCCPLVSLGNAAEPASEWQFSVLLDGRPIGTHHFELAPTRGDARELTSQALMDVKILGFTIYRYRHHVEERWQGDCLASVAANTDDDGKVTTVSGEASEGEFTVLARAGKTPTTAAAPGCVMSFAYWNPQLAKQHQLLDPGTGQIEPVTITALPASTIQVRGKSVAVTGLRISGLPRPIDVWYAGEQWVGLDTSVEGGRLLTYRLL